MRTPKHQIDSDLHVPINLPPNFYLPWISDDWMTGCLRCQTADCLGHRPARSTQLTKATCSVRYISLRPNFHTDINQCNARRRKHALLDRRRRVPFDDLLANINPKSLDSYKYRSKYYTLILVNNFSLLKM